MIKDLFEKSRIPSALFVHQDIGEACEGQPPSTGRTFVYATYLDGTLESEDYGFDAAAANARVATLLESADGLPLQEVSGEKALAVNLFRLIEAFTDGTNCLLSFRDNQELNRVICIRNKTSWEAEGLKSKLSKRKISPLKPALSSNQPAP